MCTLVWLQMIAVLSIATCSLVLVFAVGVILQQFGRPAEPSGAPALNNHRRSFVSCDEDEDMCLVSREIRGLYAMYGRLLAGSHVADAIFCWKSSPQTALRWRISPSIATTCFWRCVGAVYVDGTARDDAVGVTTCLPGLCGCGVSHENVTVPAQPTAYSSDKQQKVVAIAVVEG